MVYLNSFLWFLSFIYSFKSPSLNQQVICSLCKRVKVKESNCHVISTGLLNNQLSNFFLNPSFYVSGKGLRYEKKYSSAFFAHCHLLVSFFTLRPLLLSSIQVCFLSSAFQFFLVHCQKTLHYSLDVSLCTMFQ